jgi:hypothetical protein
MPQREAQRIVVCDIIRTPPEIIKQASDHSPLLIELR